MCNRTLHLIGQFCKSFLSKVHDNRKNIHITFNLFLTNQFIFYNQTLENRIIMADTKADKTKVDLGLLEEDDEFEEFPAEGIIFT